MRSYAFQLVNVFAESHFGGNPLAVFPHAEGLSDEEMQAIAKQFNLSETVFAFPSQTAAFDLRIFTPNYEMPLAGHPILGCAAVLKKRHSLPDHFRINVPAKCVEIHHSLGHFSMEIVGFTAQQSLADNAFLAELTGLSAAQILSPAYYMNAGTMQILLQVADMVALAQLRISREKLQQLIEQDAQPCEPQLYLWCEQPNAQIGARMFFEQDGAMLEDSGTGSACANLGAYFILQGKTPRQQTILQGDFIGRPNRLSLTVTDDQHILVGGNVIEVGEGRFFLQPRS